MALSEFDLALVGSGLLPPLMAICVLDTDPHARLLVLSEDPAPGGSDLELIIPGQLDPAARAAIDRVIVREWPRYIRVNPDGTSEIADQVALLDPVQVWLELEGCATPPRFVADCRDLDQRGRFLMWRGGSAFADRIIRLDARHRPDVSSLIVGADVVRRLDCPVIEDCRAPSGARICRQSLPLGDDRVLVRSWEWLGVQAHDAIDDLPVATDPEFYALLSALSHD